MNSDEFTLETFAYACFGLGFLLAAYFGVICYVVSTLSWHS